MVCFHYSVHPPPSAPSQGHIVRSTLLNTWQAEFMDRQPMRMLLLGRASAALSQSEPRNRTRTSELGGHAITWRWEKKCQHGPVARTRCECATAITRRRREETVKIENAVDGAAFLHRSAHGRSTSFCPDHPTGGWWGCKWIIFYLTELETRGFLCMADCHVVERSSFPRTVLLRCAVSSGARLWARQAVESMRPCCNMWRSDSSNKHPLHRFCLNIDASYLQSQGILNCTFSSSGTAACYFVCIVIKSR